MSILMNGGIPFWKSGFIDWALYFLICIRICWLGILLNDNRGVPLLPQGTQQDLSWSACISLKFQQISARKVFVEVTRCDFTGQKNSYCDGSPRLWSELIGDFLGIEIDRVSWKMSMPSLKFLDVPFSSSIILCLSRTLSPLSITLFVHTHRITRQPGFLFVIVRLFYISLFTSVRRN